MTASQLSLGTVTPSFLFGLVADYDGLLFPSLFLALLLATTRDKATLYWWASASPCILCQPQSTHPRTRCTEYEYTPGSRRSHTKQQSSDAAKQRMQPALAPRTLVTPSTTSTSAMDHVSNWNPKPSLPLLRLIQSSRPIPLNSALAVPPSPPNHHCWW